MGSTLSCPRTLGSRAIDVLRSRCATRAGEQRAECLRRAIPAACSEGAVCTHLGGLRRPTVDMQAAVQNCCSIVCRISRRGFCSNSSASSSVNTAYFHNMVVGVGATISFVNGFEWKAQGLNVEFVVCDSIIDEVLTSCETGVRPHSTDDGAERRRGSWRRKLSV